MKNPGQYPQFPTFLALLFQAAAPLPFAPGAPLAIRLLATAGFAGGSGWGWMAEARA